MKRSQTLPSHTHTRARVSRTAAVAFPVDTGGISCGDSSLPPTEKARLRLSFTTSFIDLLIILFTGNPTVGDQRPSLYSILFFSTLFYSTMQ